jgi:hypothetical protein
MPEQEREKRKLFLLAEKPKKLPAEPVNGIQNAEYGKTKSWFRYVAVGDYSTQAALNLNVAFCGI